jgi:hypothetical protein
MKHLKRWWNRLWANDPVWNCKVHRTVGCAHVDGPLCDMRTCNIRVSVEVTPKQLVEVPDVPKARD